MYCIFFFCILAFFSGKNRYKIFMHKQLQIHKKLWWRFAEKVQHFEMKPVLHPVCAVKQWETPFSVHYLQPAVCLVTEIKAKANSWWNSSWAFCPGTLYLQWHHWNHSWNNCQIQAGRAAAANRWSDKRGCWSRQTDGQGHRVADWQACCIPAQDKTETFIAGAKMHPFILHWKHPRHDLKVVKDSCEQIQSKIKIKTF